MLHRWPNPVADQRELPVSAPSTATLGDSPYLGGLWPRCGPAVAPWPALVFLSAFSGAAPDTSGPAPWDTRSKPSCPIRTISLAAATCWSSRNDCDRPFFGRTPRARRRAREPSGLSVPEGWPCTRRRLSRRHTHGLAFSGPALLRHPTNTPYCCFLPDLTGFEGRRRAGPGLQRCAARCRAVNARPRTGLQPR